MEKRLRRRVSEERLRRIGKSVAIDFSLQKQTTSSSESGSSLLRNDVVQQRMLALREATLFSFVIQPLVSSLRRRVVWASWQDVFHWWSSTRWKSVEEKALSAFIVNICVYEIWRSRNATRFRGVVKSSKEVKETIWNMLKLKISMLKSSKKWKKLDSWSLTSPL